MTLVELNPVEIYLIIKILQIAIHKLEQGEPPPGMNITKDKMKVMSKEIQSVIYKLEKSLQK